MTSALVRVRVSSVGLMVGALVALGVARPLAAQDRGVSLGIQYREGAKTSVIVLPIAGATGDTLTRMLSRDLDFSDRFNVVSSTSAPDTPGAPNYALFTKLGVDGIVQASVLPTGWLRVALHDVGLKKVRNTKDFPLPAPAQSPAWRMAVHGVSDGIEEWVTGQRGIAQSRIAFTRGGRIWTVDSDGANLTAATPSGMSPQWLPSGRGIVYAVLDGSRNPIMFKDLVSGAQRTLVSEARVEHTTPVVSPDGRTIVYARGTDVGTDLYAQPIDGGASRRITVGRGRASTQPTFSPDGQRVAFMSDRSGHPEVYISDLDGTNAELLTAAAFGDRDYRAGPDWSPDGRLVAFQSRNGGTFQIMTINLRDQAVRSVTNDGRNDDPSWAPDSRHLVLTSNRSGMRQLWVVDAETGRARQLTFGAQEARLSAWSPRLLTQ
ncbi:MAG: PD40 domain-containing protein [Gemmatimonadaceae bacterium]|nr:PD40 domain-containing protein [Gemmatimonadaceae bacterium]